MTGQGVGVRGVLPQQCAHGAVDATERCVCVQEGVTGHGASIPQLVAILKQESQLLLVHSVQPPGVICHPLVLYNLGG